MRAEVIAITPLDGDYHFTLKTEEALILYALVEPGTTFWGRWYSVVCGFTTCVKDGRRMILDGVKLLASEQKFSVDPASDFTIEFKEPPPPLPDINNFKPETYRKDIYA